MRIRIIAGAVALLAVAPVICAQSSAPPGHIDRNVIYGMHSGLALLMDVYRPTKSKGFGVIYIGGSAWHSKLDYDATPLKDIPRLQEAIGPLVNAGYTVFVINHRAAPRFRYPSAVEDAQRAVRFVRYHAKAYGIRPKWIGAAGHSSGASLALLVGVLDGTGTREDADPANRESAKVQCVVALAPATDFIRIQASFVQSSYLGVVLLPPVDTSSAEYRIYRDASPVSHVTGDDPPSLLIHGDADDVVAFRHSELMNEALRSANVKAELLPIRSGKHFPPFPKDGVDPFRETVSWFDEHLKAHDPAGGQ
jgi:acetyl esterase/lipase